MKFCTRAETRRATLLDAAELIERRLIRTTGFANRTDVEISQYQLGIRVALRECQALLREEATRATAR